MKAKQNPETSVLLSMFVAFSLVLGFIVYLAIDFIETYIRKDYEVGSLFTESSLIISIILTFIFGIVLTYFTILILVKLIKNFKKPPFDRPNPQ